MPTNIPDIDEGKEHVVYYSAAKVAELAHCVIQTVYRHLENGKFPNARRIGDRKWLIPKDDVVDYIGYDPDKVSVTVIK